MKSTVLTTMFALTVTGCASIAGQDDCGGGYQRTVDIHYGDSELRVTPPVQRVFRSGSFVLRLKPSKRGSDTVDYETVKVTVEGKSGDDGKAADWIKKETATYDTASEHSIGYCVPEMEDEGEQYYGIVVEGVGELDPRVDVRR